MLSGWGPTFHAFMLHAQQCQLEQVSESVPCFFCIFPMAIHRVHFVLQSQSLRNLIGINAPNHVINSMSSSDLAKLIYRDNVAVKHASRKRLAQEMADKSYAVDLSLGLEDTKDPPVAGAGGPLTRALKNYLLYVSWHTLRRPDVFLTLEMSTSNHHSTTHKSPTLKPQWT